MAEKRCKDTRKCCFRANDPKYETGCKALNEVYKEDGDCPYCKENRSDVNHVFSKQDKKKHDKKKKQEVNPPLPENDVVNELRNRIRYCANLHPEKWRDEDRFLRGCLAAFQKLAKLEEENRWRIVGEETPAPDSMILMTVMTQCEDEYGDAIKEREVEIGHYGTDFDTGLDKDIYKLIAWRYTPEPYEGDDE